MTRSPEFSFEFNDLEIAPGISANGEADFIKLPNGHFEMTGLSIFWDRKEALRITDSSSQLWVLIAAAFIEYEDNTGRLSDACEKAEQDEYDPDYWRDEKMERMRVGLI
jgi:hypothetical protein